MTCVVNLDLLFIHLIHCHQPISILLYQLNSCCSYNNYYIVLRAARVQKWDVFDRSTWESGDDVMERFYEYARKTFKVLTYLIFLPCILTLLILSKGSVLIAVSNLRPLHHTNHTTLAVSNPALTTAMLPQGNFSTTGTESTRSPTTYSSWSPNDTITTAKTIGVHETSTVGSYDGAPDSWFKYSQMQCSAYYRSVSQSVRINSSLYVIETYAHDVTKCVTIPVGYNQEKVPLSAMSCIQMPGNYSSSGFNQSFTFNDTYPADQCFVSRNYWIWSLFLMMCVPHVFVFLRCFWRVLFKKKKTPRWQAALCVFITETLYTIGICVFI